RIRHIYAGFSDRPLVKVRPTGDASAKSLTRSPQGPAWTRNSHERSARRSAALRPFLTPDRKQTSDNGEGRAARRAMDAGFSSTSGSQAILEIPPAPLMRMLVTKTGALRDPDQARRARRHWQDDRCLGCRPRRRAAWRETMLPIWKASPIRAMVRGMVRRWR
ncbi:MAG: hypothetical protein QOI05_3700, partial [Bradyrhizobium sp.]|nr:hypothetical protein [Bradyrhizobium sp.]